MKKILLMDLSATATEADIGPWLSDFGLVVKVDLLREEDAKVSVAVVEMDIGDGQASFIVSQINDYWHDDSLINARLPKG